MKKVIVLLISAAVALGVTSQLQAKDGPHDKAIKARQAMFQIYNYSMGTLSAMAKGEMEYNADVATEAAKNLEAAANLGQSTMWPQGSDNENEANAKNRAKKEIWETFPAIVEKADALKTASAVLAQSAGNGLEALQADIGKVGASCKGCHDDYRAKRR